MDNYNPESAEGFSQGFAGIFTAYDLVSSRRLTSPPNLTLHLFNSIRIRCKERFQADIRVRNYSPPAVEP